MFFEIQSVNGLVESRGFINSFVANPGILIKLGVLIVYPKIYYLVYRSLGKMKLKKN